MKIFIGGLKIHHQQAFAQQFPGADLVFAAFEERAQRWLAKAKDCDLVIVDQSRCTHTITNALRTMRQPLYFTDSKAHMREIIKEAITNGKVGYRYT